MKVNTLHMLMTYAHDYRMYQNLYTANWTRAGYLSGGHKSSLFLSPPQALNPFTLTFIFRFVLLTSARSRVSNMVCSLELQLSFLMFGFTGIYESF